MLAYKIHHLDDTNGWHTIGEYKHPSHAHESHQWAFAHLAVHGGDYLKIGDLMYTIEQTQGEDNARV